MLDSEIKFEVIKWAAFYVSSPIMTKSRKGITHSDYSKEHRLQIGSKAIFHLEAFVAKFMAIYKRYRVVEMEYPCRLTIL